MASAMAYFQANRGKLSGQISANVVSSSRTSEGINYIQFYQKLKCRHILFLYMSTLSLQIHHSPPFYFNHFSNPFYFYFVI